MENPIRLAFSHNQSLSVGRSPDERQDALVLPSHSNQIVKDRPWGGLPTKLFLALAAYLEAIRDREHAGDLVGADVGEVAVHGVVHDAFERHVAVLDDDAD